MDADLTEGAATGDLLSEAEEVDGTQTRTSLGSRGAEDQVRQERKADGTCPEDPECREVQTILPGEGVTEMPVEQANTKEDHEVGKILM